MPLGTPHAVPAGFFRRMPQMMQGQPINIIPPDDAVGAGFDNQFERWISKHSPQADETARASLRAIAWYFYTQGRSAVFFAFGRDFQSLGEQAEGYSQQIGRASCR